MVPRRLAGAVSALVVFVLAGSPVAAQATLFTEGTTAPKRVRELETAIRNDAERDMPAFGSIGLTEGWSGSFTLRATASSGNTDAIEAGLGVRLNYFDGSSGHRVRLSYDYSETDGSIDGQVMRAGYEFTRDFGGGYYAFGELRSTTDQFGSTVEDHFAGAGGGYRLLATGRSFWALQTGPGWRLTETADGERNRTIGYTVSSYYSRRLGTGTTFTNDTSLIGSEGDAAVLNDMAIKIRLRRRLSLRTSLLTEYQSDPLPGYENTDNTLSVSLVYSFN